jgi:hypothetical protein
MRDRFYWQTNVLAHRSKKLPDFTDFFVVKNISTNYIKIEEGADMNSNHSPICKI